MNIFQKYELYKKFLARFYNPFFAKKLYEHGQRHL